MLNDFLEGFFPSEIKGKYPNGTPFRIVDHSGEIYDVKQFDKKNKVQTIGNVYEQFRPYTREEFLKKLPEQVINRGKVIPVRSEIAKKLGVISETSTEEIEVLTEVTLNEKKGVLINKEDITQIKVKTEKGKNTVLIKVLAKDVIGEVYKYVEKYSENGGKFVLRRNFPPEEFKRSDTRTLKELDLYPSGALIMKEAIV